MNEYKRLSKELLLFSSLDKSLLKSHHSEEAKDAGLFLVGKSENADPNYKNYLCLACGCRSDFQVTHVRRSNIKCKKCLELDYKSRGQFSGFTFIKFTEKHGFAVYKREACGHELEISLQAINKRVKRDKGSAIGHSCMQCYEAQLKVDAEARNMTYLGLPKTKSGVFRHYKFNDCGHTRDINASCIARGNFFCSECKEERYAEDAAQVGLTYRGLAKNRAECKRLYELPCGHLKEIRMDHARDGSYLCSICGDSHYTKPSTIYLLKIKANDSFSWLKLGFAKNLRIRKNNYGLPKGAEVEILSLVDVPTGAIAVDKEKKWHKLFRPYRINPKLMKEYHKFNGFTECYSTEIENEIVALMNGLRKELNE